VPRYVYTLHAQLKLKKESAAKLGINKIKIEKIIQYPEALDESEKPVIIAIGKLTETLSLNVPYRKVKDKVRIITFYPARRGRYESKILSGR